MQSTKIIGYWCLDNYKSIQRKGEVTNTVWQIFNIMKYNYKWFLSFGFLASYFVFNVWLYDFELYFA